jgi:hypothetical protein
VKPRRAARESSRPDFATPNFDTMVAVASGPSARVGRWVSLLAKASIASAVAQPCGSRGRRRDYAELWVDRDDADQARHILRAPRRGEALIW